MSLYDVYVIRPLLLVHALDQFYIHVFILTAIIGAGIGGTSAAHFIRQKFGPTCEISIFEPGHVGGRLETTIMAGKEYEVGGSIIHSDNKLMVELVKETGE